jgi:short-subunit dehydrogenase
MKKVLIIGGTSAIARATALNFAKDGADLYLADIKLSRLEEVQKDIQALSQGANISIGEFPLADINIHKSLFDAALSELGEIDAVLIAHGTLPDQEKIQNDNLAVTEQININFTSVVSLATVAAAYFEEKGSGCIAAISSVAGDRGRQSNYVYGAAKGGISLFMQGMRNRFAKKNIAVVTIKPGFVDTPMTANMPKNPLYSSPETVGKAIFEAMKKGSKDIAYIPGFWRLIMIIIRMIPESIFKKLSL